MGLGKTLSMIALIASDKDSENETHLPGTNNASKAELRSTLIIVPLSRERNYIQSTDSLLTYILVLAVWETQLRR